MIRFPIALLEGKKLTRVIFSLCPSPPFNSQLFSSLLKKAYEMGAWCFDLPSLEHVESFKRFKQEIGDETLLGLCHLKVEEGLTFFGNPLQRFESKMISTIKKDFLPPHIARRVFPQTPSSEVFTQKEIDHILLDPIRFDKILSPFKPEDSPFLLIGGRYGDWLLSLGRMDLLKEMVARLKQKGFIPIYSGQWTTFILPKAKPLEVAAYAIPINKNHIPFDFSLACNLIKRFDKPLISLNPLANGSLLKKSKKAFSFLFQDLKVHSAIVPIQGEKEMDQIEKGLESIPSLIPPRKT
ncbi:MAG: hypothetical protein ACPL6D_08190 [Thermodesulfobacteriota bacterium]